MRCRARFSSVGVRHDFVAGVEGGQETSNPIRTSYTINKINTVPFTTLVNPDETQPFAGTGYIISIVHTKAKSIGLYFVDTIKLGKLFELSGGIRWDRFDTGYNLYQPTPPPGGTVTAPVSPIDRLDEQPSYRAALVYKPSSHGSVYFDYGTSFNPAAESLSLSVGLANSSAAPEENESYEAGAKWGFLNDRLLVEGAWFRTEKDNARETDPTNSNNIVAAGNQLVKGVAGQHDRSASGKYRSYGRVCISRQRRNRLEILSHCCRLSARQRTETDIQSLRHSQPAPAV